jgi:hypothetical protein
VEFGPFPRARDRLTDQRRAGFGVSGLVSRDPEQVQSVGMIGINSDNGLVELDSLGDTALLMQKQSGLNPLIDVGLGHREHSNI